MKMSVESWVLCLLLAGSLFVQGDPNPAIVKTLTLQQIIDATLAHDDAKQTALKRMQYTETATIEQLDAKDGVTQKAILEMLIRPGENPPIKMISAKGDNIPTDPDEAGNQDKARYVESNKQIFTLRSLVDCYDLTLLGEDQLEGQRAYVIGFTPRPDQPYRDQTEKVVHQLHGRMWVSAQTYNVIQTEATLLHPVSIAWFLARIPKLEFHFHSDDADDDFAPCQVKVTLDVRAPFVGFHERQTLILGRCVPRN